MRTKPLRVVLSFLALLVTVHGNTVLTADCVARAWVRAPDLTPSAIIHGDARVKLSAECPAIGGVSLGLRFKERSLMKVLRSQGDPELLSPEPPKSNSLAASLWELRASYFANKSVEEAGEKTVTKNNLWIIREEEGLVFETKQSIDMGDWGHGTPRDAVQDFSILVPSTNFPAAFGPTGSGSSFSGVNNEMVIVGWIYEYFAQIFFSNRTTQEVSAGYTAFQPLHDPTYASRGLTSEIARLKPLSGPKRENAADYSVEISTDSGLTFFAGTKDHAVTVVVKRTGLVRTFAAPVRVFGCVVSTLSQKWASGMKMSSERGVGTPPMLRAVSHRDKPAWRSLCPNRSDPRQGLPLMMPNSTSEDIRANKIVTTTSEPITMSIGVDERHIPTFEAYYQTFVNSLSIELDEDFGLDDPAGEYNGWAPPQFEDDEEAWVPWEKKPRMVGYGTVNQYSGRVPVVVHPFREVMPSRRCLRAGMSEQVVMSDETDCGQRSLVHYLNEGARGPIFVDQNAIDEILAEDPAERELRAPVLKPVVFFPSEGGAHWQSRYYRGGAIPGRPTIYVGQTWVKRVANNLKPSAA